MKNSLRLVLAAFIAVASLAVSFAAQPTRPVAAAGPWRCITTVNSETTNVGGNANSCTNIAYLVRGAQRVEVQAVRTATKSICKALQYERVGSTWRLLRVLYAIEAGGKSGCYASATVRLNNTNNFILSRVVAP